MRISSFDEAVAHYNSVHPIRGARLSEDLRPLNERRRWWERIAKIDENKYVLLDGNYTWHDNKRETWEKVCPVIWERKEDGDYITIRNHPEDSYGISRYIFLQRFLPREMWFHYSSDGKHYVKCGDTNHFLAKFKGSFDHQTREWVNKIDRKIMFKHENGEFIRANELQPKKIKRIDKAIDAQYTVKLKDMWEWMHTVLPIMGERLYVDRDTYVTTLTGYNSFWRWEKNLEAEELRAILDDAEHPKRVALAVVLANAGDAVVQGRFTPNPNSFKKVRHVVRRVADLYQVEMC